MPVFYNPVMGVNRDITVLLLRALGEKGMTIADPLAGSGVRTLRLLKELPSSAVGAVFVNDANPLFPSTLKKNAAMNKISLKRCVITSKDANIMLRTSGGFDFIDIDPFGSPAPFLDSACMHLSRGGILALTATDTAALSGTSPAACRRKYWATPLRAHVKHEIGMRILARKAQLVAAQYDKALVPIYCHATEHYMRIFLLALKSKTAVEEVLAQHGFVACHDKTGDFAIRDNNKPNAHEHVAGPLWTGHLWDPELADDMLTLTRKAPFTTIIRNDTKRLVTMIAEESCIDAPFFYDIHDIASKLHRGPPAFEPILVALGRKGFAASRTHFLDSGMRTTAPFATVRKAVTTLAR
jgi:tRNA (guanine26-N2/guanine27-N2)-dimethyltransferase